jgi:hypothetical protein
MFGETPKDAYNPECLVPNMKYGSRSVIIWPLIFLFLLDLLSL